MASQTLTIKLTKVTGWGWWQAGQGVQQGMDSGNIGRKEADTGGGVDPETLYV